VSARVLRFANGPDEGARVELAGEFLVLGRVEAANGLCLRDEGVSRRHAEVFRLGERWFVRDLGSRNGTLVNGERVPEALLEVGDVIELGTTVLFFEERGAGVVDRAEQLTPPMGERVAS
jgi:pSer/pThr/pTyr-binding forkhead associated (FHA) protein